MMKTIVLAGAFLTSHAVSVAQLSPEITSWIINTTGATGYGGIPTNVQTVQYSSSQVYVSCSCIPSYSIGPWAGNPNVPANQNFIFKISRAPQQNTGTPTPVGLGHIGVFINGVSIFNVSDAQSYNNAGVWNRNAYYWEGIGFDECLGHPQQQGEYHHHTSPKCLYDINDSTKHSPIIGYAFDGFPVYGAYGYSNPNTPGNVKRMISSYTLSSGTTRTNGPAIGAGYPAGCFIEDFQYSAGHGDLDARNGRYCVTPEYPSGTYAYFVTLDASLAPAFPYTFFGSYYGTVQAGNTGPGSGHNTITETTTAYHPTVTGQSSEAFNKIIYRLMPNPTQDYIFIYMGESSLNNVTGTIFDSAGKPLQAVHYLQPSAAYTIDLTGLPPGIYTLLLTSGNEKTTQKIIKY